MAAAARAAESGVRVGTGGRQSHSRVVKSGGAESGGATTRKRRRSGSSDCRQRRRWSCAACECFTSRKTGHCWRKGLTSFCELVREAGAGNGRTGKISAFSRLDFAQCDGYGWSAGDGQERASDSRQARSGCGHRSVAAGSCGLPAHAWRGDTVDLRASILEQPGAFWCGAGSLNPRKDYSRSAVNEGTSGQCHSRAAVGRLRRTEKKRSRGLPSGAEARLDTLACDYLACGFHLVPNPEFAALAGCQFEDGYVQVDELQRTTVPGVFCAGEPRGIGGVELALVEGQIAGLASGGRTTQARELFAERASSPRNLRRRLRTHSNCVLN